MSLDLLPPKERKGSRARCVLLTHGPAETVAARLTRLVDVPGAVVRPTHNWAPRGFAAPAEVQLDKAGSPVAEASRTLLRRWWLGHDEPRKTPTWDLVSEIAIEDRSGILLVEAKAHDRELMNEEVGKRVPKAPSEGSDANRARIGAAIDEAKRGLTAATRSTWSISRDSSYQMSNRFAWAWRLAHSGVPVVLVYLGFLGAEEMRGDAQHPLASHADWERLVRAHSRSVVPADVWNSSITVGDARLTALIRSTQIGIS